MEIDTKCIHDVLKANRDIIIQDIQGDVIAMLYEKNVLTIDEYQDIKSEENPKEEAGKLLDLLPSKGIFGMEQFINYLSSEYSWIAETIQKTIQNEYHDVSSKKLRNALTIGEVPQLCLRHITRTELVNNLKNQLQLLEAGNFVVVCGMTGCGKSSLVVEVLQDPTITMDIFKGCVQWVNVGRGNSTDVGCIQAEVLNRLHSNQEQLISPPLNTEYEEIQKILTKKWKQSSMYEGLLILDDVSTSEMIKYMDINCKMLITTNDDGVMDDIIDSRITYVRITEGFLEKETLELFSKCLDVNSISLPTQASKLHSICKGFPLTISLIGAQLEAHKEDTKKNLNRWNFYLQELSDKHKNKISETFKYNRKSIQQLKSLEKAIKMSINDLPENLRKYYQDFVLFVYDVNIKPEVLSVLWNLNKIQVEDIMLEFIRKSLAVRIWNQPLNSYIYSIHDLLLDNLKNMINNHEKKLLHNKLIDQYRANCHGNFADLPKNDNYIFLYFGYHLKEACLFQEFSTWFLNLKFLEAKTHASGPADLLADLRKYREYIFAKNEQCMDEVENFIKRIGPHMYKTQCDIVQLGLQEPKYSFIYKKSLEISKSNGQLYFHSILPPLNGFLPKPIIFISREKIQTVIFGNSHNEIIVGNHNGDIKVWDVISNKLLYTYYGHSKSITHLAKNKLKDRFLSTSDDSKIIIWNIISSPNNSETSVTRTPSPETRQDHWQSAFNRDCINKQSKITDCVVSLEGHTGPVVCAQFSSSGELVVSSSIDKTLKIWKLDSGILHKTIIQSSVISCCWFMESVTNDRIVYSTTLQNGAIYGSQWPFDDNPGLLYPSEKVLSIFPLPEKEGDDIILVMTPKKSELYKLNWNESIRIKESPHPIGYQEYKSFAISEGNVDATKNSRLIALALNNGTIRICDLLTGYNFMDLDDPIQGILNMDWLWSNTERSSWLLCAADNGSVRLWCLDDSTKYMCTCKASRITLQEYMCTVNLGRQETNCCKLKPNFDAVLLDGNIILIAAMTKCGSLKIMYKGLNRWAIIDKKISALFVICLNQTVDQTMIIVACDDLSVHSLKENSAKYLFSTSNKVDKIYACCNFNVLTVAMLLKTVERKNEMLCQKIEIWRGNTNIQNIYIKHLIECHMFPDTLVFIYNYNELKIINVPSGTKSKLEINNCIKINGSLMLDKTKLAVADSGSSLKIFKIINNDINKSMIEQYKLPFNNNEQTVISMSHDSNFLVVGGQKCIVLIDRLLKTTSKFLCDSNMNYVRSLKWSSDDKLLTSKEDNQIAVYNVKAGEKIASVSIVADKLIVDSNLENFVTINTAGHLVVFKLSKNTNYLSEFKPSI